MHAGQSGNVISGATESGNHAGGKVVKAQHTNAEGQKGSWQC